MPDVIDEMYHSVGPTPLDILFLLCIVWIIYMILSGKPLW
jgi:hypothetical protein